ncbi:iron chelate uptake ABC transporter family permease subunit [Kytococcus sp. HMSC28H12]|uniref:FecCD family ABC transporter permease n=1 Tax=Kytococcus sp. HMSC28H12 TaxID=1581067 RepID=UPI000ACDBFAE|nr:iron chelate uptake ABC transporter family permease subunit [Kytococcus sp. HMSC28H12]
MGRRHGIVLGGLAVLLLALFAARVLLGDYTVTLPDFLRILGGENIPVASFLVMESKLPRAAAAVVAGLAFGAAGATFQSVLRNPLASPDVVGVSVGASFGALFALVVLEWTGPAVALSAAGGGLAVTGLLVLLSRRGPADAAAHTMVLTGIGLSAALMAGIHWLLLRTELHKAQDAVVWLSGSVNDVLWREIGVLALLVAVLLPLLVATTARLGVLELGDDLATGLGEHPTRLRGLAMLLAGPIARALNQGRTTVLGAGLVGACIFLAADYTGAYLAPGGNLPVGIVTGLAGGPFLLGLLLTSRRWMSS